ncbi:winged helix-turn-helix domain-containing protein [Acidicapsa dinghuensis]|uniref:Winged helix-turn-helix domain-containing protein n=1 Tax=Acidicapsa dinghuensis TaxID=2218256 RepID=A0ABW1EF10_9BACT|nr:winged helix-turn-helix domain-containing protein [Acidicapsa dinghuensis]
MQASRIGTSISASGSSPNQPQRFRFQDFEIDLSRRTLHRNGHSIFLGMRTFDVLSFFVRHPQRVISKETIAEALWPESLAEESNLNQHIFLLRKALSGTQSGDRLIVTIPKRGFQFTPRVIPVEDEPDPDIVPEVEIAPTPANTDEPPPVLRSFDAASHTSLEDLSREPFRSRTKPGLRPERRMKSQSGRRTRATGPRSSAGRSEIEDEDDKPHSFAARVFNGLLHPGPWQLACITFAIAVIGFGGFFLWRWAHRSAVHTPVLIIAEFTNNSGVPQFDPAARTAVYLDFEQSPWFDVPAQAKVDQALAAAKTKGAGAYGSVCRAFGAESYLTGEVHRLTRGYLLTLSAFRCGSGRQAAVSRGIAETTDGLVSVLDRVVWDMRRQLGESPASVSQYSRSLFEGRASSLEALKAFADGDQLANTGKLQDAVAPLQHAVEIDPQFALAFADLGGVYADLGQRDFSVQAITRAFQLRSTVDDRTRLFIAAMYNTLVTGDLRAGIHNYKDWIAEYPNGSTPFLKLAQLQIESGNPAQALDPAQRAVELDPANPEAYVVLARAQMHLDQFERVAETCRLAIDRQIDGVEIHEFLLQTAFLRLDQAGIDEQIAWARGKDAEPEMQWQQALMDFAQGKAKAGAAMANTAIAGFRAHGADSRAAQVLASMARIEAELGLIDAAESTLSHISGTEDYPDALVAMAHAGMITRTEEELKAQLDAHLASTLWQEYRGPQVRAAIALNEQRPSDAIDALKPAESFDLSGFGVPALRGRAYLMAHQPAEATAEFSKIQGHSGVEPLSHDYPLAQLGLARADVQAGRTDDARMAYRLLLQIWKDADSDLPRLKEAKSEYARLAGETVRSSQATPSHPAKRLASARR